MSKIKVGKLTRRPFTLIALLACLTLVTPSNTSTTIAAAPAPPSGYGLSGTVYYYLYWEPISSAQVIIYKRNGSSWDYHGFAYADSCGDYTYDTGGPGEFMGSVAGYYTSGCYSTGYNRYVSGSDTAEVSSASPYASLYIYTW